MADPTSHDRPTPADRGSDFAFVGGMSPPRRPALPETPVDVLVEAIGILVDQQRRPTYRCRVISQTGTTIQQHELDVRPLVGSYVCTDLATGLVDSSDGVSRVRIVSGEPQEMLAHEFPSVPLPARLAFPLQLPVWGRPNQHRMTGAVRLDDEIVIELTHVDDPHLRGTLTVDLRLRVATRLETVGAILRREEVDPSRWIH